MFAQKKKKSKLWLVIPVILALAAGLWLNADLKEGGSSSSDDEDAVVQADSDQYEDISDLSRVPDVSSDLNASDSGVSGADSGLEGPKNSAVPGVLSGGTHGGDEDGEDTAASPGEPQGAGEDVPADGNENSESPGGAGKIRLIAGEDGNVVIYRYDDSGAVLSQTKTDINLSLLTEADQEFFTKGVTLNTESELSELLQDFEG